MNRKIFLFENVSKNLKNFENFNDFDTEEKEKSSGVKWKELPIDLRGNFNFMALKGKFN